MSEEIRNLLIVGRTCRGKSALANVLSDSNDFAESESSIKKINDFQKKVFEWEGTKYCVVGTIGVDIRQAERNKISSRIDLMPKKINQVLFVVDGRFATEEIEMFELF